MFESAKTDLPLAGSDLPANIGVRYHTEPVHSEVPRDAYLTYDHGALNVGGVAAPSRAYLVSGPNGGASREYGNLNIDFPRNTANPAGPVSGGQDNNTGSFLAYQASLIQALSQGESARAVH